MDKLENITDAKDRFSRLCFNALVSKGLVDDEKYRQRLKTEFREVEVQDKYAYFLKLFDTGFKSRNENNLLVPFLLGICDDFDIDQEAAYVVGEFPDIDLDFLSVVRDYLKQEWAPKTFGREYVAQIGAYGTYKLAGALIDMTRVFGKDRNEILKITTKFDLKDDEGEPLTWDKALQLYPAFKDWVEKNPEVAAAAKALTGRNRNISQHAAGLVISSQPLNDFVPLMGKDYKLATAWTEGQANSDLAAVGIVKSDLLVLKSLDQIEDTCELIKQRHPEIKHISALPGGADWSDKSYINDPACLKAANAGDLRMVFQFDSEGIRKLVRQGGVTSFDDIAAYTALYRPGPMECFPKHCKVKTKSGFKTVTELNPQSDELAFIDSEGKESYSGSFLPWRTGKKKILRIKTKGGRHLDVSPDHRILTENGKFTAASKLQPGLKIGVLS